MKKNRVISFTNLPSRVPVSLTALVIILLDYYDAPEWLVGVSAVLLLIIWVSFLFGYFTEKKIDIVEAIEILDKIKEDESTSKIRGRDVWEKIAEYKRKEEEHRDD